MKRQAFVAFSLVTCSYVILGVVVFHFIEGNHEVEVKRDFAAYHKAFLEKHPGLTNEDLVEYASVVLDSQAHGAAVLQIAGMNMTSNISALEEAMGEEATSWDLASAALFCVATISTIGYGNVTPKSPGGQAFCIFYALIGIPLCATTLMGVGERLQIPLKKLKKAKPWIKSRPDRDEQLKTAVFLSAGMLILIFLPAFATSETEHWTYLESIYFAVITLTTIGFGDYVPEGASSNKHVFYLYRCALTVWICLGLSWIALILSEVASFLQETIAEAASNTQHKLSSLEDMVVKKAKQTRQRLSHKIHHSIDGDSNFQPSTQVHMEQEEDSPTLNTPNGVSLTKQTTIDSSEMTDDEVFSECSDGNPIEDAPTPIVTNNNATTERGKVDTSTNGRRVLNSRVDSHHV